MLPLFILVLIMGKNITTYHQFEQLILNEEKYNYQKDLTEKLDSSNSLPLTQELLNEIVLWKVNRYATIPQTAFDKINSIDVNAKDIDEELTKDILTELLGKESKGIQLAMASTILRFRNPNIYQIIDQRAFRFAMEKPLEIKHGYSKENIDNQIVLYLDYLRELQKIAILKNCDFKDLDRILYMYDKQYNDELKIKY